MKPLNANQILKLSKVTWLNVAVTKMFYQLFSVFEFYEIDNPIDLFRNKHKEQGKFEDNLTIVLIYLSLTTEAFSVNILLSQCQQKPAPSHNYVREN